jgi:hypothetical protein
MLKRSTLVATVVLMALSTAAVRADDLVPFTGSWHGRTLSAVPVSEDPPIVLVVSGGTGQATQLGRYYMESPHFTVLSTLEVYGEQIFTAANGDQLFADIAGQFTPTPEGSLEATLSGVITGGTGRFLGATGTYDFHIVASPVAPGVFDSVATIDGEITSVGSR